MKYIGTVLAVMLLLIVSATVASAHKLSPTALSQPMTKHEREARNLEVRNQWDAEKAMRKGEVNIFDLMYDPDAKPGEVKYRLDYWRLFESNVTDFVLHHYFSDIGHRKFVITTEETDNLAGRDEGKADYVSGCKDMYTLCE